MKIQGKLAVALVLGLAGLAAGCSLAIKGGITSYADSDIERVVRDSSAGVWEIGAGLGEYADRRIAVDFGLDFVSTGGGTDFLDMRGSARYRFRRDQRLTPFAGLGAGWYRWSAARRIVIPEPFCFVVFDPLECVSDDEDTLSDGLYPYATAGFDFRITDAIEWVVEDRYDFSKDDGAFDFEANQILTGFRFRLR